MNEVDVEQNWLSLAEYSNEYGVSVSTLRRRIKAKKIKHKLVHGKYFLPRQELPPQSHASTPVPISKASGNSSSSEPEVSKPQDSSGASAALLDELKKTYRQALQSKEDQIIHLKQQISDLKTLVMYLERENSKYNPQDN